MKWLLAFVLADLPIGTVHPMIRTGVDPSNAPDIFSDEESRYGRIAIVHTHDDRWSLFSDHGSVALNSRLIASWWEKNWIS